ncbi:MAG TPA: Hpt domain-containing protein [Xanthomonadaceae bacterium]|jgi:chemosensory pili system protein ChpA (sensor histidine kinase/response regulator)
MRLEQDTQFTTLSWVKPELDETLKQARQALEAYVEDGGDRTQMQTCAAQLHQVQGVLRMVEIYGAAMVAEEMEQLAHALLGDSVANRDEAYGALIRSIMQLPDYLERLQSGHKDIPMVLLPLLNDLRGARGEKVVPESVLFSVDINRPLPASAGPAPAAMDAELLRANVMPLHATFQNALLPWLRDEQRPDTLATLHDACARVLRVAAGEPARKLLWIASNVLEALQAGAFVAGKPLKQAIAQVEREIKRLGDEGETAFAATPPNDLVRQLLYYVSSAPTDHKSIVAIREAFGLSREPIDESELAHARGSLTGHNRELLDTVSAGIKEDLLRVKEALDMHLRTSGASVADLAPQGEALGAVADTLGMLGLGVPRKVVQDQRAAIQAIANGQRAADENALLEIAGSLLYVEASLDDQVARLGQPAEGQAAEGLTMPLRESQQALDALIKESVANFVQARQCFVAFIEAGWDHAQLHDVPRLLDEVSGAMQLLEQPRSARQLHALSVFTQIELVKLQRVPDAPQMDRLADALASLEYYLEALRDHRPQRDRILELAEHGLVALGYWPIPASAEQAIADAAKPPAARAPAPVVAAPVAPAPVEAAPVEAAAPEPVAAAEPAPVEAAPVEAAPVAVEAAAPMPAPVPAVPGKNYGFADSAEIDDDIREVFIEELDEEVTNLGDLFAQWTAAPHDMDVLRPLRRVFHTLKGSGRLVGAMELGEFSWKFESMLNRVLDGSRPPSEAVLALIGLARDTLPQFRSALMGNGTVTADIEGMKDYADRVAAGEEVFYAPAEAAPVAPAPVPEPVVEAVPEPVVEAAPEPVVAAAPEPVEIVPEPVVAAELPVEEPAVEEPVEVAVPAEEEALADGSARADVDPVLLEILRAEVVAHLQTIQQWGAANAMSAQPVSDALLRAVHTISGAFAMTEVPLITDALSPTEGYIRRLLVHREVPSSEGVALVRDVGFAIQAVLEALQKPNPVIASQDVLAERAIALRDALPEPTTSTLSAHAEEADAAQEAAAAAAEAERAAAEKAEAERLAAEQAEAERVAAEQAEAERVAAEQAEAERVAAEQAEAERIAAEQAEAERVAAEKAEADRLAAEQAEAERAAAEQAEAERLAAEHAEAERVAAERAEADRLAAEQAQAERAAAEQAEAERLAAEHAEAERVAAERAESERVAAEQAEAERVAAEQAEAERHAAEQAEAARIAAEREAAEQAAAAEAERQAAERHAAEQAEVDWLAAAMAEELRGASQDSGAEHADSGHAEAERLAAEQAEAERMAAEKAETERAAAEQAQAERAAAEQAEAERVAAEQAEAEQATAGQAEAERAAAERAEAERLAAEQAEAERLEYEKLEAEYAEQARLAEEQRRAAEQAEAERVAAERAEAERMAAEQAEAERLAAEQAQAERHAAEQAEAERLAAEQAEAERVAAEQAEAERVAAEQAEAERLAAEQAEAERVAAEEAETQRLAAEHAEAERVAAEHAENERIAAEQAEAERVAAERAEAERVAAEQAEAERMAAEQAETGRLAAERAATEAMGAQVAQAAQEAVVEHSPEPAVPSGYLFSTDVDPDPEGPLDLTDVDPDLLDIFVEETTDILDHSDGLLSRLREAPTERESVVGLQRDLHTLKGGARMCGMMSMGELAHAMESVLEGAAESRLELSSQGLGVLEQGFDRLHGMLSRITSRQAVALPEQMISVFNALARGVVPVAPAAPAVAPAKAAPVVEVPVPAEPVQASEQAVTPVEEQPAEAAAAESAAPAESVQPARGKHALKPLSAPVEAAFDEDDDIGVRAPQEQVRIRADLLDRLVNYAGEVAIYRARLEQQLGSFRSHLDELDQTTTRLRQQLRKLEIETEAQISARHMRAGEEEKAFDPLELDRFSTQQQLTRALAESATDMSSLHASLDDVTRQYETLLLQQSRVSSELQDGLMRTRMVPFDALVPRLRRVIRQAATETSKQIQLKVEGAQGEMDRNVLDRMTAPLEHMLRNSAVHGLETPAERRDAGKPEEGTVTVSMRREGSEVVMNVSDDGRGLNRDAIRKKAIERGLLKPDAEVSDNALYAFILESGFSTADTVSRLAGRGVGMDVVHNEIRQLGGSLQLDSTAGKGTTFTIRLPFTLAVTQAAIVKIGETSFAVPISSVQGVGRIARDELEKQLGSGHATYLYGGEEYDIHDLGRLLGQAAAKAPTSLQMPLLLSRSGDIRAAICVDEVLGSREIVVKPVGPQVSSIPGIFGATIMGDGGVMVILDVVPLVRRAAAVASMQPEEPVAEAAPEVRRIPLVMVVDDSITMRKVTGRVLERHNMEVLAAKDGVDAIEKMAEVVPDVMLLDIEMPRMDGYELATHMRNDPRLRDVAIIMITSRTGEKHRQRAFEIGVNRYLGKPYQEAELMRNVFELLSPVHQNV